jgi:hypothetical protein
MKTRRKTRVVPAYMDSYYEAPQEGEASAKGASKA